MRSFLRAHPMTICDVGARGDPIPELKPLLPHVRYFAVDADEKECDRLNRNPPRHFASFICLPACVGDGKPANLTLYRERGWSSILELSTEFQASFLRTMPIDERVAVQTVTLDRALEPYPEPVDFLKLDTQGSELTILENAPRTVRGALLIETEVEFLPMYKGQPTFDAMHRFMLDRGFELLYLNRVVGQKRRIYKGPARGQLVWGDALYGRSPKMLSEPPERMTRYAILLANYGHLDWTYEIFSQNEEVQRLCPAIGHLFRKRSGKVKTFLLAQFDKLLFLGLHLRKFNHLRWDSDRSWPVR